MFKSRPRKQNQQQSSGQPDLSSELINMFLTLQDKLNSPVFTGGFEKLLLKIESIEASQKQTTDLVSTINKTIYEPDEGLFSRIRKAETSGNVELQKISNAHEGFKKDFEEMKEALKAHTQSSFDVATLRGKVQELEEWRKDLGKKLWVLVPVILSLISKLLWDMLHSHISLK